MQLEYNDEVFFIHANTIYKGLIKGDNADKGFTLYIVDSPLGLKLLNEHEVYSTVDKLVNSITYEEPVRASQEFKTWSVT